MSDKKCGRLWLSRHYYEFDFPGQYGQGAIDFLSRLLRQQMLAEINERIIDGREYRIKLDTKIKEGNYPEPPYDKVLVYGADCYIVNPEEADIGDWVCEEGFQKAYGALPPLDKYFAPNGTIFGHDQYGWRRVE